MIVRQATQDDKHGLVRLSKEFYDEHPFSKGVAFSFDRTAVMIGAFLQNPDVYVGVAEVDGIVVGMAGITLQPLMFSNAWCAVEIAWYIHPDHRGGSAAQRLFHALEEWSIDRNANLIVLSSLHNSPVDQFYLRCGYEPYEHNFVKFL